MLLCFSPSCEPSCRYIGFMACQLHQRVPPCHFPLLEENGKDGKGCKWRQMSQSDKELDTKQQGILFKKDLVGHQGRNCTAVHSSSECKSKPAHYWHFGMTAAILLAIWNVLGYVMGGAQFQCTSQHAHEVVPANLCPPLMQRNNH